MPEIEALVDYIYSPSDRTIHWGLEEINASHITHNQEQNLTDKPIFDVEIDTDIPLNSFKIRKCGVQFGELSARQHSRLEYFIRNHTLDSTDFNKMLQPWTDDKMALYKESKAVESIN